MSSSFSSDSLNCEGIPLGRIQEINDPSAALSLKCSFRIQRQLRRIKDCALLNDGLMEGNQ